MADKIAKTIKADVGIVTNKVITYTFTVGIIVALVLGLLSQFVPENIAPYLTSLLIIAGIIVGFFNIHPEEARDYVVFVTALVIVTSLSQGAFGAVQIVGNYLEAILSSILAFIVPSVIIVGVRSVLHLARS